MTALEAHYQAFPSAEIPVQSLGCPEHTTVSSAGLNTSFFWRPWCVGVVFTSVSLMGSAQVHLP
jgi:hypothetical protein